MNYWFTADEHYNHANIIIYCNRPYYNPKTDLNRDYKWINKDIAQKRVDKMNKDLIRRFNERVKPEDITFHLGDFCFYRGHEGGKDKPNRFEEQLNGKHIHILGNHSKNNGIKTIIESLVINYGKKQIRLVHNPAHFDYRYSLTFCGHVHQLWKFKRVFSAGKLIDLINVGVDVNQFYPRTFEELMKGYRLWLKGKLNDKGEQV